MIENKRLEYLQALFDAETQRASTKIWRNNLNAEETKLVNKWDSEREEENVKMCKFLIKTRIQNAEN